jgi:mannosyltransferase OCH1-like enzyme
MKKIFIKILVLLTMLIIVTYYIFNFERKELSNIVKSYDIENDEKIYNADPEFKNIKNKDKDFKKINYKRYKNINNEEEIFFDKPIYEKIIKTNILENYPNNNKTIPKKIWQTFREEIKADNPLFKDVQTWKDQKGYEYNFLDDKQGEEFIKNNFDEDVLKAYKTLIPGAYKADLLRVCLIYIHGGVYADIKVKLNYPLDYFLDRDLVLVKDHGIIQIWNGFFAAVPKHPFLKNIIEKIVERVKIKYYGYNGTDITGPLLWYKEFTKYFMTLNYGNEIKKDYRMMQLIKYDDCLIISKNGNYEPYMSFKKGYHKYYDIKKSYPILWNEKKVYDEKLWEEYFKN